ncbi:MAG: leucine-rich repeat domain-containing protein [Muribaculaceae bacterium]
MKKRLPILLMLCIISLYSMAADFIIDNVTYTVIRDGAVGIKDVNADQTEFNIPATVTNAGVTYDVKRVEEEAFKYTNATSIILPNSVDTIMNGGIYSCPKLLHVRLPNNLQYIGRYGLSSNNVLASVELPTTLTEIPSSCFSSCYKLADIRIPEGIKTIGSGAFYKCAINQMVVPESCDSIAKTAFLFCAKLEEVKLPSKLFHLGDGAFNGCTALGAITLPPTLEFIGDETFLGCSKITSMELPASLNHIGNGAFAKTGITQFTVNPANRDFVALSGVVYSDDKSILWAYPSKGATTYSVEKGCIGLGGGSFWGANIQDLTVPEGMKAFDSYTFCESQLAKINFPKSLVFMGDQALAGTQFTSISLPENLFYVSDGLLAWSKKLKSITLPSGIIGIANHAFQTCSALTEIHCLGSVPPVIDEYYDEEDNPFGYITRDNVTVSMPAGYKSAYKNSDWSDLFSNLVDSEKAPFAYASITPAAGTKLKAFEGVTLNFAENATIITKEPTLELRKVNVMTGTLVSVDNWLAVFQNSADKKVVNIVPCDYDLFVSPVKLDDKVDYYLTIPAGIIKNAAGNLNEKYILHIIGDKTNGITVIEGEKECSAIKDGENINVNLGTLNASTVAVYDAKGQLINQINNANETVTFNLAGIKGLCIVKIISSNKVSTFKVMM